MLIALNTSSTRNTTYLTRDGSSDSTRYLSGLHELKVKAYLSGVVKRQLATPQGNQFKLKTQEQVGNKVTVTLSRKAAGFSLGG